VLMLGKKSGNTEGGTGKKKGGEKRTNAQRLEEMKTNKGRGEEKQGRGIM